jgi:uncharacterized protein YlzI (FlbEa/FlbD family)
MLSLTTLEGMPIFIAIDSIELIEQQEDGTCICTKSNKIVFVLEAAAEINFDIMQKLDEKQSMELAILQMRGIQ